MSEVVTMMCLTTKQKFEVTNPTVIVLKNGRYAYRVECPWKGKNGKDLYAFKFCSHKAYLNYTHKEEPEEEPENTEEYTHRTPPGSPGTEETSSPPGSPEQ